VTPAGAVTRRRCCLRVCPLLHGRAGGTRRPAGPAQGRPGEAGPPAKETVLRKAGTSGGHGHRSLSPEGVKKPSWPYRETHLVHSC